MPYCPQCRSEFQDWVKVCPDCKVALVEKLPPKPRPKQRDEPTVYLATAPNEMIADMWADILKEQGIGCWLKSGELRAAMYSLPYNQQCELHVLASAAERAKEILAPFLKGEG
jgi:hypothetical protein